MDALYNSEIKMKSETTIFNKPQTIDFMVTRFSSSKAVWVGRNFYSIVDAETYKNFENQFSYVISDNECFEEFGFDRRDSKICQAEHYGGIGVGDNGGGVRCGNFDGFQIKGIGKNPLVGSEKEKWHSYGGLHAKDAVYELIYAQVLEKLLPVGVAKIHGVIFTTSKGAYKSYTDADGQFTTDWGALLVREICLRPGHFIRSPRYKPNRNNSTIRIPSDMVRVKSINKHFRESFNSTNDLIMYLGKFLQNCANQFAFARVARVMHTGICPSNLCFDGRWIDLTNSSFIGGGENLGGTPPFYDEPFAVIDILREFTDTFSKYNHIDLNVNPLINYYTEQLSSYFSYHAAFLFAIEYSQLEEAAKDNEYKILVEQVGLIINSGKMVINQWPEKIKSKDPVIALIKGLFLSLCNEKESDEQFDLIPHIKNFSRHTAIENFKRVIHSVYCSPSIQNITYVNYISSAAIAALKRALFPEYFYKIRLDKQIELTLSQNAIDGSGELIDDSIAIAEWVFASIEEDFIYIFKSSSISIYFNKMEGIYCFLEMDERVIENFTDISNLMIKIENIDDGFLSIQNYNFKIHILSILAIAKNIQTNCSELI